MRLAIINLAIAVSLPKPSAPITDFSTWKGLSSQERNPIVLQSAPSSTQANLALSNGSCEVKDWRLVYTSNGRRTFQMIVAHEEDEKIVSMVCNKNSTVILMKGSVGGSINVYPGANALSTTKPEELGFMRAPLGFFEEGGVSPSGEFFVVRDGKHIEVVQIFKDQLNIVDSYDLKSEIEKVEAQASWYSVLTKDGRTILFPYLEKK